MRRTLVALALVASSWTATQPDLFGALLRFLSSFGNEPYTKEGCGLDPNGHCETAPQTDSGCGLDPWGACKDAPEQPQTDAGCGLDPYGCPNGS